MGEIHELFVLALSLVWFAGATPEAMRTKVPITSIFSFGPADAAVAGLSIHPKFGGGGGQLITQIWVEPRWEMRALATVKSTLWT